MGYLMVNKSDKIQNGSGTKLCGNVLYHMYKRHTIYLKTYMCKAA